MSKRDHRWSMLPEVDASRCDFCGLVASMSAIASRCGVPTWKGWVTAEGSYLLPDCIDYDPDAEEHDPDVDMALLLAGELPPAP